MQTENAEGVYQLPAPGCARSALPWDRATSICANPPKEGLRLNVTWPDEFANSFRVHLPKVVRFPGHCPGLELANAFGVTTATN